MGPGLHIAIVGAGPAGLAAALFLHRDGHCVTIFEKFERPKPVGSGLILQPTGLSVLNALNLLPGIVARGARIDRLHGADAKSGRTVLDVGYAAGPGGRFGVAVHRAALFGVLYRAVLGEGIAIVTDTDVARVEHSGQRPGLIADNGASIGTFDLVIDASGTRSRLKAQGYAPAEPRPLAYGAFWASLNWRGAGFDPHALSQRYDRARVMIGVLPIGRIEPHRGDMAAFFWSLKPAEAEAVKAQGIDAWRARVAGYWPDCAAYLDQIDGLDDLTLARYGHHTLKPPAGRGLAIIGDAAHSTSPQLGQGANMALLDAAALSHALRGASDVAGALAAYAAARRFHVRLFQALSYLLTPFYQSDSTVVPFLRDTLVSTVARVPPAPRVLAAMVSGMLGQPLKRAGVAEPDWAAIKLLAKRSDMLHITEP
jgi:2-polyprenyl-6-methoxyphenol hydroxylase-like FAD-dependent oxidoreductase